MHRFPFTGVLVPGRIPSSVEGETEKKKKKEEKKRKEKKREEKEKNIERRAKEVKEEGRREWNTSRTGKKRLCPIGELYGLGMGHSVPLSDPL